MTITHVQVTIEQLIAIGKEHIDEFNTYSNWTRYAKLNNLPSPHIYERKFGSWNKAKEALGIDVVSASTSRNYLEVTDEELIKIAIEHSKNFTTMSEWDRYAELKKLPPSSLYKSRFVTWNKAKENMGFNEINHGPIGFNEKELLSIAIKHKEHFISHRDWNEYAKIHDLPRSSTYIRHFGYWEKVKAKVFENAVPLPKPKYNKEILISLAKDHAEYFTTYSKWNKFAKDNDLPNYDIYSKVFGSWSAAVKEVTGKIKIPSRTGPRIEGAYKTDELIRVAQEHKEFFTTTSSWDSYASLNKLPSKGAYKKRFGSWNEAKENIFGKDIALNKYRKSKRTNNNIIDQRIADFLQPEERLKCAQLWELIVAENCEVKKGEYNNELLTLINEAIYRSIKPAM